jgi:hypothetical protein
MPTVSAQGDLTADGTEQTVWDVTTSKWFSGYIDLEQMTTGDTVLIKRYIKVRSSGASTLVQDSPTETYTDAQTAKKILYFAPMPSDVEYMVTLQQTVGTFRVFPFKLYEA